MHVWVCGSRDLILSPYQLEVLGYTLNWLGATHVIHGAARGIDSSAGDVARAMGLSVIEMPADWHRHGKRAGPIRNEAIAALTKVHKGQCLAIYRFPQPSRGTADALVAALRHGLVTHELRTMVGYEEMNFLPDVYGARSMVGRVV